MDKNFKREFTKCPCCGSEERFLEQLGNEMKDRGLAREEWNFHLDVRQGVVLDPTKEAAMPIGSEAPVFHLMTDICIDCGCVYAIEITRSDTKKPAPPPAQPNRAMRRRVDREGGPPLSPNPNPFN